MPSKATALGPRTQLAALAWRRTGEQIEVLMITSRLSRHWLIPKGWPMKGRSDTEAAAREAYEEAGIKGSISDAPIGSYEYAKQLADGAAVPCLVEVYALKVEKELPTWPEASDRARAWMSLEDAAKVAFEAGLATFLAGIDTATIESTAKAAKRKQRAAR